MPKILVVSTVSKALYTLAFSRLLIVNSGQNVMQFNLGKIYYASKLARQRHKGERDAEGNVSEMPEEHSKT